jgi:riboflavin kinase/FMN adenylyltransferase
MRIVSNLGDLAAGPQGAVVAIGNFDGMHLGHQAVIEGALAVAHRLGTGLSVLTFEPHPRRYFRPGDPPFCLTSVARKAEILEEVGAERLIALPFDEAMASMTAPAFVSDIVVGALRASHVVIGYDFAFGHKRVGDAESLRRMGGEAGFGVTVIEPAAPDAGEAYSSGRIREHLRGGRPAEAARLLGRWWRFEAVVGRGAHGIYAVRAGLGNEAGPRDAVASLGTRPTFDGTDVILEVHILDFAGALYGKTLRVDFIAYLRPEEKFASIDALKAQMATDCAGARQALAASTGAKPA